VSVCLRFYFTQNGNCYTNHLKRYEAHSNNLKFTFTLHGLENFETTVTYQNYDSVLVPPHRGLRLLFSNCGEDTDFALLGCDAAHSCTTSFYKHFGVLGGLLVSVLLIGLNIRGFKPGRG
jgi:hypothetical protein